PAGRDGAGSGRPAGVRAEAGAGRRAARRCVRPGGGRGDRRPLRLGLVLSVLAVARGRPEGWTASPTPRDALRWTRSRLKIDRRCPRYALTRGPAVAWR